jgi:hypothetical protein
MAGPKHTPLATAVAARLQTYIQHTQRQNEFNLTGRATEARYVVFSLTVCASAFLSSFLFDPKAGSPTHAS